MSIGWLLPDWPGIAGVRAGVSLRTGGLSEGRYASLNLGTHVGDSLPAVTSNRERLRRQLDLPSEPRWLEQVHGCEVIDADLQRADDSAPPRADAAVSRRPGTVLAVLVADCLPVLFAARDGSAVGIAHAGWRGLAAGVIEATVAALAGSGPLQAWIGPGIGPRHFEVGADVREAFVARDAAASQAFRAHTRDRWLCDLPWLATERLARCGVAAIHASHACTYADSARFYSFRRDGVTGRMAALVWRC